MGNEPVAAFVVPHVPGTTRRTGTAAPLPCSASAPRARVRADSYLQHSPGRVAFESPGRLHQAPVTFRRPTVLPRLAMIVVRTVTLVGGVGPPSAMGVCPKLPLRHSFRTLGSARFQGVEPRSSSLTLRPVAFPDPAPSPIRTYRLALVALCIVELFAVSAFHEDRRAVSSARWAVSPPSQLPTPARVERTSRGFVTPSLLKLSFWSEPRGGICVSENSRAPASIITASRGCAVAQTRKVFPGRPRSLDAARHDVHGIEAGD